MWGNVQSVGNRGCCAPAAGTSEIPGGDIGAGLCGIIPRAAESEGRAVMISNGIALENYMSSQLEQNDLGVQR